MTRYTHQLVALLCLAPDEGAGGAAGDGAQKAAEGAKGAEGEKSSAGDGQAKDGQAKDGKQGTQGDAAGTKDGANAAGDSQGKAGDSGQPKAPEEFALTLPEGGHMTVRDVEQFRGWAKQYGWSEEETQSFMSGTNELRKSQRDQWLTTLKADREYGGPKLAENQAAIRKLINRVVPEGDPYRAPLDEALSVMGGEYNIGVFAALARLANMMAEDGGVTGAQRQTTGREAKPLEERALESMYGGSAKS